MKELHQQILDADFTLKDEISEDAKDLIRGLLKRKPKERLGVEEILKHKWFNDVDKKMNIFNDGEKCTI